MGGVVVALDAPPPPVRVGDRGDRCVPRVQIELAATGDAEDVAHGNVDGAAVHAHHDEPTAMLVDHPFDGRHHATVHCCHALGAGEDRQFGIGIPVRGAEPLDNLHKCQSVAVRTPVDLTEPVVDEHLGTGHGRRDELGGLLRPAKVTRVQNAAGQFARAGEPFGEALAQFISAVRSGPGPNDQLVLASAAITRGLRDLATVLDRERLLYPGGRTPREQSAIDGFREAAGQQGTTDAESAEICKLLTIWRQIRPRATPPPY